jgi:hypothetical protein
MAITSWEPLIPMQAFGRMEGMTNVKIQMPNQIQMNKYKKGAVK